MYNKNQITEFEAKIAAAIKEDGTDESQRVEDMVAEITGPQTGLIYTPGPDGAPGTLSPADGWDYDADGNLIDVDRLTGPGTGKVFRDGHIVDA